MELIGVLFSFRGRIGRTAFWVSLILLSVVMTGAVGVVALTVDSMVRQKLIDPVTPHVVAIFVVGIPFLWPLLAVQVKRWHDINRSGWWILINLIPTVGSIVCLFMCGLIGGTGGTNRYGTVPAGIFRVGA